MKSIPKGVRGQAWQLFFIFFVSPDLGFALEDTDGLKCALKN